MRPFRQELPSTLEKSLGDILPILYPSFLSVFLTIDAMFPIIYP